MAAVTGELTGRPGACLTTLGPGVASAANGIAYAALDRAPLLVFTDPYPEPVLALTSHQQVDAPALLGSLVKWSAVLHPGTVAATLERAGRIALAEPRGPVHLDLAPDVAPAEAEAAARLVPRADLCLSARGARGVCQDPGRGPPPRAPGRPRAPRRGRRPRPHGLRRGPRRAGLHDLQG